MLELGAVWAGCMCVHASRMRTCAGSDLSVYWLVPVQGQFSNTYCTVTIVWKAVYTTYKEPGTSTVYACTYCSTSLAVELESLFEKMSTHTKVVLVSESASILCTVTFSHCMIIALFPTIMKHDKLWLSIDLQPCDTIPNSEHSLSPW